MESKKVTNDRLSKIAALYNGRSATYDSSWHSEATREYTSLANLRAGSTVLDVACGTGLITLAAASDVGPTGIVIGIDIADSMLAVGRSKAMALGLKNVKWIIHDVTRLDSISDPSLLEMLPTGKKFDVIFCASALVLMPNPPTALKHWATFLEPGGKLITDMPVESAFPASHAVFSLAQRGLLGISPVLLRRWYVGKGDLEQALRDAGLTPTVFISKTYAAQKHHVHDLEQLFDQLTATNKHFEVEFESEEQKQTAQIEFGKLIAALVGPEGILREERRLYFAIGVNASTQTEVSPSDSYC